MPHALQGQRKGVEFGICPNFITSNGRCQLSYLVLQIEFHNLITHIFQKPTFRRDRQNKADYPKRTYRHPNPITLVHNFHNKRTMAYRSKHAVPVENHSDQHPFLGNTPCKNIVNSRISAQLRLSMAAMGIESPDLRSSRNSTLTYRELGTITTDLDDSTVSTSEFTDDSLKQLPENIPDETIPLSMNKDDTRLQNVHHNDYKEVVQPILSRALVSSAVKSYLEKKIEKEAETFFDEARAKIVAKLEDWLKRNMELSQHKDRDNDLIQAGYDLSNDSSAIQSTRNSLGSSYYEDAVLSINTTPSDVVVVVSPGLEQGEFLSDIITHVRSPSPVRAFQKHRRKHKENPILPWIENCNDRDRAHDSVCEQKLHIPSRYSSIVDSNDMDMEVEVNQDQVEQCSPQDLNKKHRRTNSILNNLRTSPLLSPTREIKTMRDLEHELAETALDRASTKVTSGPEFENHPRHTMVKSKEEVHSNPMQ